MDEKAPLLPLSGTTEDDIKPSTKDCGSRIYRVCDADQLLAGKQSPRRPPARMLLACTITLIGILFLLRVSLFWFAFPTASIDLLSNLITTQHSEHHTSPHLTQLARLDPSLLPTSSNDRRILVVGDVHGCPDSLQSLLDEVHFHDSTDHLILAGDIINKGPDSSGAVRLARDVGASCVRGNHEDKCLSIRSLQDDEEDGFGESSLSKKKLKKKLKKAGCSSDLSKQDVDWLAKCPLILELGDLSGFPHAISTVVVHAGLVPGVSLEDQDPFAVMNMRAISRAHHKKHKQKNKGKFVPEEGRNDGEPWYKVWNKEQGLIGEKKREGMHVLYGHDSKTGLNVRKWSTGLDSGCVNGGRLSGLLIDHKGMEIVSVKCKH